MEWIAHTCETNVQPLQEHLRNVAELTEKFCSAFEIPGTDVGKYAYETGLVHDIGKYSQSFQKKIRGNPEIHVDHSTAGAKEMQKRNMPSASFAIAGHHGGIPNGSDHTGSSLLNRLRLRKLEPYDDYEREISLSSVDEPGLPAFDRVFFTRMLFSSLVDADFLDTEQAVRGGTVERGKYDSIEVLYERLMASINMAGWRNVTEQTSKLDRIRTDILEQCIESGKEERGLYSLTVPTGGGKTVSSLAFALTHAKVNHMDRVIYVIPYTSIIEQTVDKFGEILGKENVLAHYSNSLLDQEEEDGDYYNKHKLSIENWDAPVIVTTSVQFFESLYANKVSKCRKLHNIANAVIVFDEVQMLPLGCIKPCVKAIQTLVDSYAVSAVFCTATQPVLDRWMRPLHAREICENYPEVFRELKRAQIKKLGKVTENEIFQKIAKEKQVLVIVNTKKEAQNLYEMFESEEENFHLSTYMTPSDRKNTLKCIRERLDNKEVCRVISTSLVEAGVDLDFPTVYRELAGLDSIIQAAGRCNRNGGESLEKSIVWVFQLEQRVPKMIEKNIGMTEETLLKYGEFDSLDAIHYYFTALQSLDEEALDQYRILERIEKDVENIMFPFKRVAEVFHMIDSDTKMLIIQSDEKACQLVDELQRKIHNGDNFKSVMRKMGFYAINVYEHEYRRLIEDDSAYELIDGVGVLVNEKMYTENMGLRYEGSDGATLI